MNLQKHGLHVKHVVTCCQNVVFLGLIWVSAYNYLFKLCFNSLSVTGEMWNLSGSLIVIKLTMQKLFNWSLIKKCHVMNLLNNNTILKLKVIRSDTF